jgi:hypothetical protein
VLGILLARSYLLFGKICPLLLVLDHEALEGVWVTHLEWLAVLTVLVNTRVDWKVSPRQNSRLR